MHKDRFQFRHGREHAGAPDLHGDGFQNRFRRRDPWHRFVDDGVARRAAAARNLCPIGERVHLEHDAVNLVRQLPAQIFVLVVVRDDLIAINFQHLVDAVAHPPELLRGQTEFGERLKHFGMSLEWRSCDASSQVGWKRRLVAS